MLERASQLARREQPFVLVTVVWRRGPTSGTPGDKALVLADGTMEGWLGGSCTRSVVVRHALAALAAGQSRLLVVGPAAEVAAVLEGSEHVPMTCASQGTVQLHLEPVLPPPLVVAVGRSPAVDSLCSLALALGWRAAVVDPGRPPSAHPKGVRVLPSLPGTGGAAAGFGEALGRLGGAVGDAFGGLAASLGEVHVGPGGVRVGPAGVRDALGRIGGAFGSVGELPPALRIDSATAVVVATQGDDDEALLRSALATPAGYVGLVASRERAAAVMGVLAEGGVAGSDLARVRAPAGLDLGHTTTGEIGVAILAELVSLRAAGKLRPGGPVAARGLGGSAGEEGPGASGVVPAGVVPAGSGAVDPVCGMAVEPATAEHSAEHAGRIWWFCSAGCCRRFLADPRAFAGGEAG